MKRKIYAIIIASIILGAGAVVATGAVNDIEYFSSVSAAKMKKNTDTLSARESKECATVLTKASVDLVELKEPYMQYQKAKLLTAEEKSFYQAVIGQWGYMNNPRSQGDIIGIYNGKMIKGNFGNTKSKTIDFKVNLFRDTFSGSIYIHQHPISISNEADIQAATVVVPIYGAYSISNGYITAFWSKGVCEPSLFSTLDEVYDGWFFGDLV